jgi:hypothetical protein
VTLKAFDQDDGRNRGWPKTLFAKGQDQGKRGPRTLREPGDSARIEDQHRTLAGLAMRTGDGTSCEIGGAGALAGRWRADLSGQLRNVHLAGGQQLTAPDLGLDRLLQQLGSRQMLFLYLLVEIVGQIDLHPRHTPKYTHLKRGGNAIGAPLIAFPSRASHESSRTPMRGRRGGCHLGHRE